MTEVATTAPARLTRWRLLAYGLPGLPLAAVLLPLYVYLPAFYAEDLGLGFATVGIVLLAARLSDIVTDPLVGALSDRLDSGFGRRRLWMLAGVPVVLLASEMLFRPGGAPSGGYLLVWTVAIYLGATMILLPYSAWGAELSSDYDERSRIAGTREGFVVVGTLVAAGVPSLLGGARGESLEVIAWGLWSVLPLCVLLAVVTVPEGPALRRGRLGWRRGWQAIRGNAPFQRLIAAYFLNSVANGLPATLFLLFVAHVLGKPEWSGPLLFVYFACGVASIPVWLRLSERYGKHRVWMAAMSAAVAVFACVPLLGQGDHWWFLAICAATGLALGADLTLPASMQADVVDLDTLRSGRERTGLYFAAWGMATKLALALAVGIAFPLLELAGFDPTAGTPSDFALAALAALYSLAPGLFKLGAVALFYGYPITAARQRRIRRLIAARHDRA